MATPRSAGRTLAVPERTGRTTHDRAPVESSTTDRSTGFRTTGHGRTDHAGAVDLDVRDTQRDTPHAKNTLPYGNRSTTLGQPTPVA
ncbi:hypothetical protein OG194_02860 [Streptomyces sp. NBC_01288]|uniref:hypothetical protein n=1 Tax=Streptomyces sp. NBC_01288 TaxID=2903814 RepID=UPI002E163237|nr:hypothetical protein OG194_02860 [Streptomyces sp. NBC_01288]